MRNPLIIAAIAFFTVSAAVAVPYASYIRVSDTTVSPGSDIDISYVLNEDADSVTINIIPDAGGAAVATTTFTSPSPETTSGLQTIVWDGTVDFAGGTPVSEEAYRVEITVDNAAPAGWTQFASNRSLGTYGIPASLETLFEGFSGKDLLIQADPDNDLFGLILASSAYNSPEHIGMIPLRTDLNTVGGGNGLADIVLQNPAGYINADSNYGMWGSTIDPTDPDRIWVVGQNNTTINFMTAVVSNPNIPSSMTDADPGDVFGGLYLRSIAIYNNGGTRYALVAMGNSDLSAAEISTANQASGTLVNLLDLDIDTRYSKDVEIDEAGNVYWASRLDGTSGETGGRLYRWDSAIVAAAIADSATNPLTDANASWVVDVPSGSTSVNGVTIAPDGEVYLQVSSDGIYEVGNVSTATLTTTLTAGQLIVDFSTIGAGFVPALSGANVAADAAGNLYSVDTNNEQIRAFSPGGTTSMTFTAPTSQTVTIATVSATSDWNLYH